MTAMREWLNDECAAALKRIDREIARRIEFGNRSAGQRRRWRRNRTDDCVRDFVIRLEAEIALLKEKA